MPELVPQIENIVCALDHDLQGAAATVATMLREKGQSVDLVLESKPLKWYQILSPRGYIFSSFVRVICLQATNFQGFQAGSTYKCSKAYIGGEYRMEKGYG